MQKLVGITVAVLIVVVACTVLLTSRPARITKFSEVDRFLMAEASARSWRGGPSWQLHDTPSEGHGIIGRLLQRIGIQTPGTVLLIDMDRYGFSDGSDGFSVTAFHVDEEIAALSIACVPPSPLAEILRNELKEKFPELPVDIIHY